MNAIAWVCLHDTPRLGGRGWGEDYSESKLFPPSPLEWHQCILQWSMQTKAWHMKDTYMWTRHKATPMLYYAASCCTLILGSLSNDDGNGNKNVTWKYIHILFVLLCDYFNSLNFYNNGKLSRNLIGRSCVQGKKENEKFTVVLLRSPKNLKRGHFSLLFCRGRQLRNVPKCKTHVGSDCFCLLNLLFCGVVIAVAVVVA